MTHFQPRFVFLGFYVAGWLVVTLPFFLGHLLAPIFFIFGLPILVINTFTTLWTPMRITIFEHAIECRFPLMRKTVSLELSEITEKDFYGNPIPFVSFGDYAILKSDRVKIRISRIGIKKFDELCLALGVEQVTWTDVD